MLGTFYLCINRISRYEINLQEFLLIYWTNVNKNKGTGPVYITKNCSLCIFLISLRLTLRFWLVIRNFMHFQYIVNNKNRKMKFDQNFAPLKIKSWSKKVMSLIFLCKHAYDAYFCECSEHFWFTSTLF